MMRDLIDKFKQLRKSFAAMKPKENALVPALKIPTVKPLSMPSSSGVATKTKLPGIAPVSGKDPKKMAEQLKNPRPTKPRVEVLKVEKNGQWSLDKAEGTIKVPEAPAAAGPKPSTVNSSFNGFGYGHHQPEQNKLIRGLDFSTAKPVGRGVTTGMWMNSSEHPHQVIVKNSVNHPNQKERGHLNDNFNSAKREVMYHNMARDFFGMGKHVPLTAGFHKLGNDFSAQQQVPNASHLETTDHGSGPLTINNPNHAKTLKDLHNSGELHKLAMMDNIMGHHDRHKSNYTLDDKGSGLHLIDNGTAFDYENFDPRDKAHFHEISKSKNIKGMGHNDEKLHPEAEKWLMNLDPKKAAEIFANHSYAQDANHVKGFQTRLKSLQEKVKSGNYKDVESLLKENRLSSGPMHAHHSEKKAA
jgi:hypothetical protein